MIICQKITEIKSELKKHQGKKISFVPTMGALHDGHLALVKKARELADIVVVSIFVNKTQFNDPNDYQKYPRQEKSDLEKLENSAVDLVFLPNEKEMFEENFSFKIIPFTENKIAYNQKFEVRCDNKKHNLFSGNGINPINLVDCLCGAARFGHFDGVALIVSKLFNIVKPDIAIFGQKDFQQLAVIKKLVRDLNFDVEIFAHETLREKTGLAMSSRNQRLSEEGKAKAANIYKILSEIKNDIAKSPLEIEKILQNKSQELLKIGFEKIDYLEIRTEDNLELVTKFDNAKKSRIFFAGYLEGVRLIDNL
jgi:pantoate--beta-alanine ligase